jgi:2-hydroxy-3-oxopropionate reductase
MVGGEPQDFKRTSSILEALGSKVVHAGPVGAGQSLKAANQVLVALILAGISEAFVLGGKAGIPPSKILEVLSAGLGGCRLLDLRGDNILAGNFEPGGRAELHYRDLGIVLEMGRSLGVPLFTTSVVHELFGVLLESKRGDWDHTAIITIIEDLANYEARNNDLSKGKETK